MPIQGTGTGEDRFAASDATMLGDCRRRDRMHRRTLSTAAAALCLFGTRAAWPQDDKSYEAKLQLQARSLPAIKAAILAATGYDETSIEVTPGGHQLFIKVINSKLAAGSNAARIDEASAISSAVTREVATRTEFDDIEGLH